MNKHSRVDLRRVLVLLAAGFLVTSLSLFVARLGTPFVCDDPAQIQPYNRDERGIPLVYVERSIQDTGCGPRSTSGKSLDVTDGHRVLWLNFAVDIVFWSLILGGIISFGSALEKRK
jgi:hypothetical protein